MSPKKSLIFRGWVIYLCVLMPIIGMSILVTQNFINKAKEEKLQNLSRQVEDVVAYFDESFRECKNKGVVLFSNQLLANKTAFSGTGIEALNLLKSFQTFNSEDKICVYYGEDKIYYANGLASQSTFYKKTLNCTDYSVQKAIEIMESDQYGCCILNVDQNSGYLMYHIPVGTDSSGSSRSMQALVSFHRLEEVLENVLPDEYTLLELCINGDFCYFYNNGQGLNAISLNEFTEFESNYEAVPLQKNSEELGLTVRVWNDIDNQLREFYYLRNTNFFILALGILISIIMALGLSVARFSQVKALVNQVLSGNDNQEKKRAKYGSELDYIKLVLNESLKNSERKNFRTYRRIMLEQVSMLIVHGIITDKEEMDAALKACGTELFEEYYYFCGIEIDSANKVGQLEELLQWDIHYVVRDKNYIFILCELHHWDLDLTVRRKVAQKFMDFLQKAGISCRQVAISPVYNDVAFMNRSYLQVYSILESHSNDDGQIVFWEEWTAKQEEKKEKETDTGKFAEIRRFIEENYTRYDLSLEMIAEHIGVSKSGISKLFKSEAGMNYIDYVSRLRMDKAKELLEKTDMNIKDVFLAVGYMDNVTAGRKFKSYFKVSPAAYRAQMQKEKEDK